MDENGRVDLFDVLALLDDLHCRMEKREAEFAKIRDYSNALAYRDMAHGVSSAKRAIEQLFYNEQEDKNLG